MADEARIRITLDAADAARKAKALEDRKDKDGLTKREREVAEIVRRQILERQGVQITTPLHNERERVDNARAARVKKKPKRTEEDGDKLTAIEMLAGGKVGVVSFAMDRLKSKFKGLEGAQRFTAVAAAVTRLKARAAIVENIVTVGLPVLGQLAQAGIEEGLKDSGIPGGAEIGKSVGKAVNDVFSKITDFAQQFRADISGRLRTAGEIPNLFRGFALTGQDFGKIPSLVSTLSRVNVFEDKLKADVDEAVLRQASGNVGDYMRRTIRELIQPVADAAVGNR